MGDYTNLEIHAKGVNAATRQQIRDIFEAYQPTFTYTDEVVEDSINLGGNECSIGAADEVQAAFHALIADGFTAECDRCHGEGTGVNGSVTIPCPACKGDGERAYPVDDFAWWITTDAKYEFPQIDDVHVPGVGDWSSTAGNEDGAGVKADDLDALAANATDLEELRAAILKLTGRDVRDAFAAYAEPAKS